ncbi:uncharacterized protein EDB91DRAFT_1316090 [Suillus paluster]|uniref:uncharacterized protein n=1 Tax=Suillus paluster TaxID=48578 RepID=UPI001B870146|nr:uncharacterized protein EDB91DRAFT_1316090 [Suillus paluster]KAG1727374.1 hypothetical protein EDB91DRAFT_1316090 [Suillus paluster]
MSFTLLPQPTILYLLIITSQCPGLTMSDIPPNTPFIKPDYTLFCSVGHGELQWKTVTSHVKGNQGHWMVSCPFIGPDGIKCSHFQWGSHSPSSSPNPSIPPVMLPPPLPVLPVPGTCAESQCVSTHVHPLCTSAMCRKHCWAIGGCDAKGHAVSGPVQATLAPPRPPSPVIYPVLIQAELSLGASSNDSTTDGEMSSSSSPGLSHDHPIEVEVAATLAWPRGYYAVDINTGFVAMDNARQSGQSVKEAFASVFGAGVR